MPKTSVVKIGRKVCRPFTLNVMVFSPASGYKVEVVVEKNCTKQNDAIWKLVFDLYQKEDAEAEFVQLVHVSFEGKTPQEQEGIERMVTDGVSSNQAKILSEEVFPVAKEVAESDEATPSQKRALTMAMSKATTVDLDL